MDYQLYRRHGERCPLSGMHETKCDCPIWAYGRVDNDIIRRSLHTRNWRAATNRLAELEESPQQARFGYSVSRAVDDFLADCQARNLTKTTLQNYVYTFKAFVAFCKENRIDSPRNITLAHLEKWREWRKVSVNSKRKEIRHLRTFFGYLRDHNTIQANVIKQLKMPKEETAVTLPYSREELQSVLGACKQPRTRAMCLVLLHTGLRISDAIQLKRGSIGADGRLLLRVEKTGVPVFIKLNDDLLRALSAVPDNGLSPYYFWSGNTDLHSGVIRWASLFRRLGKRVGFEVRAHRFRDTFAVELILAGVSIYVVSKLLGHSSIKTTERYYAPWIARMQKQIDSATDGLFLGLANGSGEHSGPGQS